MCCSQRRSPPWRGWLLPGLLVTAALGACGHPIDRYCDLRLKPGALQVAVEAVEPRFVQQYNAEQLDHMAEHSANEITLGLTRAKPVTRVQIELHGMSVPGGVCVRPDVSLKIGYEEARVDLATELRPNTCPYNQVLAHEMRHVEVYRAHLASAQTELAAGLRDRLPGPRIFRFANMAEAAQYFQSAQDEWINPLGLAALGTVVDAQAAVDTPEEYRRLSTACGADSLELQSLHP